MEKPLLFTVFSSLRRPGMENGSIRQQIETEYRSFSEAEEHNRLEEGWSAGEKCEMFVYLQ